MFPICASISRVLLPSLFFVLLLSTTITSHAGVTSRYVRRLSASQDMPIDYAAFQIPKGDNAPQQVHLTQGDYDGQAVIVSWVTPSELGSSTVLYGTEKGDYRYTAEGNATSYKFFNYTSGFIHHCALQDLMYDRKYYYKIGTGGSAREFWFVTPPQLGLNATYTFGVIGDLGQTFDSYDTLKHYRESNGQTVLYVGDLSYADHYPNDDGVRWDTWGRFIEPSTAYQTWIWTAGNHEIEFKPNIGEQEPFKPFLHRYFTPYSSSGSSSALWYAIRRASAHIIVLSSYSAYEKYTPQWTWLREELNRVDRNKTPWLIVLMHAPWYNSNTFHYMEGESMRVEFEPWFVKFKVDIVFAGHVHAYERSHRISNIAYDGINGACIPVHDQSAPVYVNVGDGGNIEGLAAPYKEPQPAYSAFREASFGHAMLEIKNHTHAHYYWHRNQDGEGVVADSYWFYNRYWFQNVESTTPRRRLEKEKSSIQINEQEPSLA